MHAIVPLERKRLLSVSGRLPDGYLTGPTGWDATLLAGIGLDPAATFAVLDTRPTYLEFERWFAATARNVSPDAIARINRDMAVREKPEAVAATERAVLGIDDPAYRLSREINDLVDWHALHGITTTPVRSPGS